MGEEKTRPTKKQRETLTFIDNFISGHGYGPSYREIQRGLGYKSVSTVANHVDNMISRGHLAKRTKSARSLEIIKSSENEFAAKTIKASDEKWLVDQITTKFEAVENSKKHDSKAVDELYVLVGALKVLGFEDAARSFATRLIKLQKSSKTN
jgi:repressor LexA